MRRVVVIGGGIAGLACTRALVDRRPDLEVTLLEAAPTLGGAIATRRRGGFLCEAGAHGFLNRHPSTLKLAMRLGLTDDLAVADQRGRGRFIYDGGALHAFPDSPARFLASSLVSWRGRMRALLEPLLPFGDTGSDVSVGELIRERFGPEVVELLADPVVAGTFGGDPDLASLEATMPRLAALRRDKRSLLAAAVRHTRGAKAGAASAAKFPAGALISFRRGTAQLVEALGDSLAPLIVTDCQVLGVRRARSGWHVSTTRSQLTADAVIAATPAPHAAGFLRSGDRELATLLGSFKGAPLATVALGFSSADVSRAPRGFGYLVPRREGSDVLGVLWSSNMFPGLRSAPGRLQVQAIVGGTRAPEAWHAPEATLVTRVVEQLRPILGLRAAPLVAEVFRHPTGIAQYEVGHGARVARARAAAQPGLFLAGSSYDGIGINACTTSAERVALAVSDFLGAAATSARPPRHARAAGRLEHASAAPQD